MLASKLSRIWHRCLGRTICHSAPPPPQDRVPPVVVIQGTEYLRDSWTNVSQKVISLIGHNLHRQQHHPLGLLKRRLVDFIWRKYRNRSGRSPSFVLHEDFSPIVSVQQNFDSLLIPEDHPSRSRTDTYYVNQSTVLRAHTSAHQWDLVQMGVDEFIVVGDVYRKDSIDSQHYPVFHQMEVARLFDKHKLASVSENPNPVELFGASGGLRTAQHQEVHNPIAVSRVESDLKSFIEELARDLFGSEVNFRWVDAEFPFTHPSWELEVFCDGDWMEVLGCGIMEHALLKSAGAGDRIGWAAGFGLERLAMRLYQIPDIRLFWSKDERFLSQFNVDDVRTNVKFKPISIYPPCINDISFWLPESGEFLPSDLLELVRDVGGDMVERAYLIDQFEHPKTKRRSQCFRIVYRHMDRTLTQSEVNLVHKNIEQMAVQKLNVAIR